MIWMIDVQPQRGWNVMGWHLTTGVARGYQYLTPLGFWREDNDDISSPLAEANGNELRQAQQS